MCELEGFCTVTATDSVSDSTIVHPLKLLLATIYQSKGVGAGGLGYFHKPQSQTISVQDAKQRTLQDGCSSNTSHI